MFVLYFLLWIIYNGNVTLELCILGILISGAAFAFTCKFADYSVKKELHNYKKIFLFLKYVFVLVREIIKANIDVIRMILTEKEEICPALVTFHTDLKTPAGKALLANAITLTPGTITVSLEGTEYTVHCLDENMAEGINESDFLKDIRKLES